MLSLGLLHILKDGIEKMEEAFPDLDYPLAILFCIVGFGIILFTEKVFVDPHTLLHGHGHDHGHDHKGDVKKSSQELHSIQQQEANSQQEIENIFRSMINPKKTFVREQFGISKDLKKQMDSYDLTKSLVITDIVKDLQKNKVGSQNNQMAKTMAVNNEKLKSTQALLADTNEQSAEGFEEIQIEEEKPKKIGSLQIILLIALSLHSVFIGISLGLQNNTEGTLGIFIAICSHKWADALTLGISLAKAEAPKNQALFMIIFLAFSTPLGIAIGMIIKGFSKFVEALFLSLSAGTFLYIATTEIIVEEFSMSSGKFLKMIVFSLGVASVGMLMIIDK